MNTFAAIGREHAYAPLVIPDEQHAALARPPFACGMQTVISYPVVLPPLPGYARLARGAKDLPRAHHNQSHIL